MRLADRVAVVTGAAGGIGAAVVGRLAEAGASVAAVDSTADGLRELVEKLATNGHRITAWLVDVTSQSEVEAMVAEVEQNLGPIDFLVHAAGVLRPGSVVGYQAEDWHNTFAVNAGGVFLVSQAVVTRMAPRRRGAIVTVASNAASVPRVGMAAYAASKAAAVMFTKSLGLEVARSGIRCNVVAPGSTETPMLTALWSDGRGRSTTLDGDPEAFRAGIPLGRIGAPDDVANAVLFLLSEQAAQITLHDLVVDGGAGLGR
jgi:2,3-dihydro-2,3-dihydroxybenzoate dehydrogenase